MGIVTSKCCTKYHETCRELKAKIQILEEEIKEMKREREQEARVYEQQAAVFARKEDEWKRERKKHKEEVAKLRKRLEEEENRMRSLEEEVGASRGDKEWNRVGTEYIMEHMKEEQAKREEAVEKWKQLYLAIKTELDDLIQRTRQGNVAAFCLDTSEICTKNPTSNASSGKFAKIYANFTLVACACFMITLSETEMAGGWCKEGKQVHISNLQAFYMIDLAKFTQASDNNLSMYPQSE